MPNTPFDEAQAYNPDVPVAAAAEPVSWAGLIGTIVIFLVILVVALWLIRKLNLNSLRNMQSSPWARVLDRQILSDRQALYLVEIAGKIQVLGVTDQQITKIAEINEPEIAAEILEEIAQRPEEATDRLMNGIRRVFKGKKKDKFSAELDQLMEEGDR